METPKRLKIHSWHNWVTRIPIIIYLKKKPLNDFFLLKSHRICLRTRTLPNYDKHFESKFSKTSRHKFKVNIFSDRVNLALPESYLTFNICRVVYENFDLKKMTTVRIRFGDKFLLKSTNNVGYKVFFVRKIFIWIILKV